MANTPFKMKGSPMKRNFGIESPLHVDPTFDQWYYGDIKAHKKVGGLFPGGSSSKRKLSRVAKKLKSTGGASAKEAIRLLKERKKLAEKKESKSTKI